VLLWQRLARSRPQAELMLCAWLASGKLARWSEFGGWQLDASGNLGSSALPSFLDESQRRGPATAASVVGVGSCTRVVVVHGDNDETWRSLDGGLTWSQLTAFGSAPEWANYDQAGIAHLLLPTGACWSEHLRPTVSGSDSYAFRWTDDPFDVGPAYFTNSGQSVVPGVGTPAFTPHPNLAPEYVNTYTDDYAYYENGKWHSEEFSETRMAGARFHDGDFQPGWGYVDLTYDWRITSRRQLIREYGEYHGDEQLETVILASADGIEWSTATETIRRRPTVEVGGNVIERPRFDDARVMGSLVVAIDAFDANKIKVSDDGGLLWTDTGLTANRAVRRVYRNDGKAYLAVSDYHAGVLLFDVDELWAWRLNGADGTPPHTVIDPPDGENVRWVV